MFEIHYWYLKGRISDLEIELLRKNVVVDYLHSQLSLNTTDNSLSLNATQNLNSKSNQGTTGDKVTEISHVNAATLLKNKGPNIRSPKQQSINSQIKRKILVAGNSMLSNT